MAKPSAKQLEARRRFADMARAAAAAKRDRGTGPGGIRGPAIGGGILGLLMAAGATAAWVEGGKLGARAGSQLVGRVLKVDPAAGMNPFLAGGVELGVGYAAALAIERFVSARRAEDVLAGAALGVLEGLLRRFNVPYLSTLAGDEGDPMLGVTYELYPERLPERELQRLAAGAGTAMAMYPGEGMGLYVQ